MLFHNLELSYRSPCSRGKKGKFIACSCHLIIFIKLYAKYYTYHSALKSKILFYNYEYDYVVGNGTMVCVDGGGSIARVLLI